MREIDRAACEAELASKENARIAEHKSLAWGLLLMLLTVLRQRRKC